jgi:hypothetical protein
VFRNRQVPTVLKLDYGNLGFNRPSIVTIDPKVFDVVNEWKHKFDGRVTELALRVATVCAAFDKRSVLLPDDLEPAYAFAKYQHSVRLVLHPNTGANTEGILAKKFMRHITAAEGKWVVVRELFNLTNAYDFGPGAPKRVIDMLIFNTDLEEKKDGKKRLVRLAVD